MKVSSLETKHDSYASFHITCECDNPSVFMDPFLWPEDIFVRWWRSPKSPVLSLAPSKLKFNLVSYNCRGLPKDKKKLDLRTDIQHLFKDNEIICLQETWFAKQDLKYINNLNKPFQGVGEGYQQRITQME